MRRKRAKSRKTKRKRPARPKLAGKGTYEAPPLIEIRATEIISVNDEETAVAFSVEQRAFLKRLMERAIKLAFGVEIGVEYGPDESLRGVLPEVLLRWGA